MCSGVFVRCKEEESGEAYLQLDGDHGLQRRDAQIEQHSMRRQPQARQSIRAQAATERVYDHEGDACGRGKH